MKIARLMIASFALAAVGCGSDDAVSSHPARVAKKQPEKGVTPPSETAVSAAPIAYTYNPVGKRDPFRSPLDELQNRNTTVTAACRDPLCQWDLDQLKLVAVVTGEANPLAMVQDPKGIGYVIHRNTRMGKLGGKVSQILRDSVVVTEFFVTPDGKSNPNPRTLKVEQETKDNGSLDLISGRYIQ